MESKIKCFKYNFTEVGHMKAQLASVFRSQDC